MPAQGSRERNPLTIASVPDEIIDIVKVLHADDFLINNRPLIEIAGDIVAGSTDEFYSTVVGALIGIRADETREEGVMNIDDPA